MTDPDPYAIYIWSHLPSTKNPVMLAFGYHTYGSVMGNLFQPFFSDGISQSWLGTDLRSLGLWNHPWTDLWDDPPSRTWDISTELRGVQLLWWTSHWQFFTQLWKTTIFNMCSWNNKISMAIVQSLPEGISTKKKSLNWLCLNIGNIPIKYQSNGEHDYHPLDFVKSYFPTKHEIRSWTGNSSEATLWICLDALLKSFVSWTSIDQCDPCTPVGCRD